MNNSYEILDPYYTNKGTPAIILPGSLSPHVKLLKDNGDDKEYETYRRYFEYKGWKFPLDFENVEGISKKYEVDWTDPKIALKRIAEIVERTVKKYVKLMDDKEYSICVLYILFTYFHHRFDFSPRLILVGNTSSGKTRFQDVLRELCYRSEKITNSSYASAYRSIDEFHMTVIIDEAQDLIREQRIELKNQIKDGFQRDCPVKKVNQEYLPVLFDQFAAMIVSTKSIKIFPEDVINRSFVFKMIECTEKHRVEKIFNKSEFAEIRTLLYWLKYSLESGKYHKVLKLKEFIEESWILLTGSFDENDVFHYAPESGIPNTFPEIVNRPFDIACSLYPFARIIGKIEDLMTVLENTKLRNKRTLMESDCHTIMDVWVELIMKKHPKSIEDFFDISHKISTYDIQTRFNESKIASGEFIKGKDEITTRVLREPLENMGFELGYGTKGRTYTLDTPHYRRIFETNLKKYSSNETKIIYQNLTGFLTNSKQNLEPAYHDKDMKVSELDNLSIDGGDL